MKTALEERPQSSAIPSTSEHQWMHYCSPECLCPPLLQANVAKGSKEGGDAGSEQALALSQG